MLYTFLFQALYKEVGEKIASYRATEAGPIQTSLESEKSGSNQTQSNPTQTQSSSIQARSGSSLSRSLDEAVAEMVAENDLLDVSLDLLQQKLSEVNELTRAIADAGHDLTM